MYHLSYGEAHPYRDVAPSIAVVGCGGTGSLVAEGLCRLLLSVPGGAQTRLLLVDPDTVEEHNLLRQAFYEGDVGGFKAQVLAHRLARLYRRPVGYSVQAFHRHLSYEDRSPLGNVRLLIGCVDNPMARAELEAAVLPTRWWIDAGNAENLGQVLIGNTSDPVDLRVAFNLEKEVCFALPAPSVQRPELLLPAAPSPLEGEQPDCAEAVQLGGQSAVINQVMASLVLEVVRRIITRTCPWMSLFVNLDRGELRTVEATPENAARAFELRFHRGFIVGRERAGP